MRIFAFLVTALALGCGDGTSDPSSTKVPEGQPAPKVVCANELCLDRPFTDLADRWNPEDPAVTPAVHPGATPTEVIERCADQDDIQDVCLACNDAAGRCLQGCQGSEDVGCTHRMAGACGEAQGFCDMCETCERAVSSPADYICTQLRDQCAGSCELLGPQGCQLCNARVAVTCAR